MYNSDFPSRDELPSTRQLVHSTLIAAVSAVVLLTTFVLPSEYGVDPTGIGRVLGLTEMGQIKTRLAMEAAEDATAKAPTSEPAASAETFKPSTINPAASPSVDRPDTKSSSTSNGPVWRDEMSFTLPPGQGSEVKLKMKEGEKASYSWSVKGGMVNFDTHGDAIGRSISYEKGRSVANAEGELVAAFNGNHGWFWRNRGDADVTVVLQTGGAYSDIKRLK
jgi:hypothetical protein